MSPLSEDDLERLRDKFRRCWTETSPVYTQLKSFVPRHDEILELYSSAEEHDRHPYQLFAAVHYLILQGEDHPLAEIYAAPEARGALDKLNAEFASFCEDFEDELRRVMGDRSVQTNDVNRCVGLLPALQAVARQTRKTLSLVELGASGGLNLLFDRFRYDYVGGQVIGPPGAAVRLHTQLRSKPPKMESSPPFMDFRAGIDLEPPNVEDEDDQNWLRACIWVGDFAREQRFTAALDLARREWPDVRKGDAIAKLASLAAEAPINSELCVFTSYMLTWMQRDEREELFDTIKEQSRRRDIWWISFEAYDKVPSLPDSGAVPEGGGILALQHFDGQGVDSKVLAHIQMHGAWTNWLDESTAAY